MTTCETTSSTACRCGSTLLVGVCALLLLCFSPGYVAAPLEEMSPPPVENTLKLVAVGDIMAHLPLVRSAYDVNTGRHDFTGSFAPVKAQIQAADLAIGNLETTLTAGGDYTGYPKFRAPADLARDLAAVGFDLLVTANNHSLDYGAAGVTETVRLLHSQGLQAVGTANSAAAVGPVLMERNGIRLAFVAYATALNGMTLPAGRDYLVRLYTPDAVRQDVARARAAGADLVISYIHFGDEYARYPNAQQYAIADDLLAAGVQLVLGSHPHVVQPEQRPVAAGHYVIYSLGNFISCQRSAFTDVGLLLEIEIAKRFPDGATQVRQVRPTPTYVKLQKRAGRNHYQVAPLQTADARASDRYRAKLTYNRQSLFLDLLGHLQGGVWRPPVPPSVAVITRPPAEVN